MENIHFIELQAVARSSFFSSNGCKKVGSKI